MRKACREHLAGLFVCEGLNICKRRLIFINVYELTAKDVIGIKFVLKKGKRRMKRKWTKQTAEKFVNDTEKCKRVRGLTYWSAKDFLNKHKTMYSIIGV